MEKDSKRARDNLILKAFEEMAESIEDDVFNAEITYYQYGCCKMLMQKFGLTPEQAKLFIEQVVNYLTEEAEEAIKSHLFHAIVNSDSSWVPGTE